MNLFPIRAILRTALTGLCAVTPLFAGFDLAAYQTIVDSVIPGSKLGLSVRSVTTGEEIAGIRSDEFFTPASTMKTLSTATAIHHLPLDYAPQTKFTLRGAREGNIFKGTLTVRGEGDPNFSARFYKDPLFWLDAIADSIRALGIDTLRGALVLDSSYYDPPWKPDHWRKDFYDYWYGAEVTPLQFNDNCALVKIKPGKNEGDSVYISVEPNVGYIKTVNKLVTKVAPRNRRGRKKRLKWSRAVDPNEPVITVEGEFDIDTDSSQFVVPARNSIGYFRAALLTAMNRRGLAFREEAQSDSGSNNATGGSKDAPDSRSNSGTNSGSNSGSRDLPKYKEFAISAAPLLSMLDEINQRSQNLHAETLFRNAAAKVYGVGNLENGRALEKKFLTEMGIDTSGFMVFDGCGLSPKNKIKPMAETQMLAAMARHPKSEFYINSFASSKIGSGSKRMGALLYPWATRFKTGYISEVHGLAGYIFSHSDTLAVALYLNETGKNKDSDCKNVMDSIWIQLIEQATSDYPSLLRMKDMWLAATDIKGLPARLDYFSKKMLGIPYRIGAMGEGHFDPIEPKPLVYMDSVDCVTYMEHALAMAISRSEDSLFSTLQNIRYLDGKISYATRKHYLLADWVGEGKFTRLLPMENDTVIVRTIPKNAFFKSKKMKYLVNGVEAEDPKLEIHYLTHKNAYKWAKVPHSGGLKVIGVAFISKSENLDAHHTGFVILRPGETPRLRHASQIHKRTVELPLTEYLTSVKKKFLGITLFEFKEP